METSEREPLMTYRKARTMSKPRAHHSLGISSGVILFLPGRRPVFRRREHVSGFCWERENLSSRCKGKRHKRNTREAESTEARHRGGAARISGDGS
jgi:hypothetical protein